MHEVDLYTSKYGMSSSWAFESNTIKWRVFSGILAVLTGMAPTFRRITAAA